MTGMKAYTVHDGDEQSVVVFAKHAIVARRRGAREMDVDFDGVESCRRFPAVDSYAPGPVPPLVLISHGWSFECCGCYRRVDADGGDYEDHDGNELPPAAPVEDGCNVYCSEACRQRDLAERAERKRVDDAAMDELERFLLARYPEITVKSRHAYSSNVNGIMTMQEASILFAFPGCVFGLADMKMKRGDAPDVFVCHGDIDAWEAYAATLPPTLPPAPPRQDRATAAHGDMDKDTGEAS